MNKSQNYETIMEMINDLPIDTRLLGLDVGSKTIWLAVSDSSFTVSTAIDTIRRTKFTQDMTLLKKIIKSRSIGGLVIGLPISMDGSEGPACQSIRQFGTNIINSVEIAITFWDERLSTSAVERFLINEANIRRKRRSEIIDKLAATYILQGAIDAFQKFKASS
jgi:putative Holliday junction resolvase